MGDKCKINRDGEMARWGHEKAKARISHQGRPLTRTVILSPRGLRGKDLTVQFSQCGSVEILRCAQDDRFPALIAVLPLPS
jgi:hypothetical protein